MNNSMRKMMSSNEMLLVFIIVGLCIFIGVVNPSFLSAATVIGTARSMLVMLMFAVCELIVILSGGIDVSFPAFASFAMFTTTTLMLANGWENPWVAFIIAGAMGLAFGLLNAVLIGTFKMPALIATLGTSSIVNGALLSFVGVNEITNLPPQMDSLSKVFMFSVENKEGIASSMSILIILPIALCVLVAFLLKYTMLGRSIRAIGGDANAAQRAGFNVVRTQYFVYMFVGFIVGVAGMTYTILMRDSNPINLMGSEMMVIAAVVVGGARIMGGHGSVTGTILGVVLIQIVTNNLIMVGVPNYWQKFVVGLIIIIGTSITSLRAKQIALSVKI